MVKVQRICHVIAGRQVLAAVALSLLAVRSDADEVFAPKHVAKISAPTLVIHGTADPLVPVEGGRDIAKKVPGARILEIEGMGHDVPTALCERIADAIAQHTREAENG